VKYAVQEQGASAVDVCEQAEDGERMGIENRKHQEASE
jgi:hypothetical protein